MIVVRLAGRLGNQLFQYAAGRALALRLGVDLGLDGRNFPDKRNARNELGVFAIRTAPVEAALPAGGRGLRRVVGVLRPTRFTTFAESGYGYDPAFAALGDWTFLKGYFQNERYFRDHAAQIRSELTFVPVPDTESAEIARRMAGCCSVSVHVRRGDYATDPAVAQSSGNLEPDYYARAAAHIAEQTGEQPTFFVFSDDPDWAEANLDLPYLTVVIRRTAPDWEDLRLMAHCRHNIIANSSFSWWGAWLNPAADKIVAAPDPWFRDAALAGETPVPDGWHRIDAGFARPHR